MMKVGIRDGCFAHTHSMSTRDDALGVKPSYFEWDRSAPVARFYTDTCLSMALDQPHPRVALLVEPYPFRTAHYDYCVEHEDEFDWILTYASEYLTSKFGPKWLPYVNGSTSIRKEDWRVYDKTKNVSLLASAWNEARGHKMRHEIAQRYGDRIDVMGKIVGGPYLNKRDALATYRYSVVIESEESWGRYGPMLDCLAVGTIPIFWGCLNARHFYDREGIIMLWSVDALDEILLTLGPEDYAKRLPSVRYNLQKAMDYGCAEDWIYRKYPFLFEGLT
jgi:hypothetical protein